VKYLKIAAGNLLLIFSMIQQVKQTLQTWQIPLENQESGTCEHIASFHRLSLNNPAVIFSFIRAKYLIPLYLFPKKISGKKRTETGCQKHIFST
jgi:hypothetical protein